MRDDATVRDGNGLFETDPVEKKRSQARPAAVNKRFRAFDPHQVLLLPPSLDDLLPEDHLARFVAELVDDVLDLSPVLADYTEKRGFPPYFGTFAERWQLLDRHDPCVAGQTYWWWQHAKHRRQLRNTRGRHHPTV